MYNIKRRLERLEKQTGVKGGSKTMLAAAKSMKELCEKMACDGCPLDYACSVFMRVRPRYLSI